MKKTDRKRALEIHADMIEKLCDVGALLSRPDPSVKDKRMLQRRKARVKRLAEKL